jgi:hypothetical protein
MSGTTDTAAVLQTNGFHDTAVTRGINDLALGELENSIDALYVALDRLEFSIQATRGPLEALPVDEPPEPAAPGARHVSGVLAAYLRQLRERVE